MTLATFEMLSCYMQRVAAVVDRAHHCEKSTGQRCPNCCKSLFTEILVVWWRAWKLSALWSTWQNVSHSEVWLWRSKRTHGRRGSRECREAFPSLDKIWKQTSISPVQSTLILLTCRMTGRLANILEIIESKGEDRVLHKASTGGYGGSLNRRNDTIRIAL